MAHSFGASTVLDLQNILQQLEKERLPNQDKICKDLKECLQCLSDMDFTKVQTNSEENSSKFNNLIAQFNKFANVIESALEVCAQLPGPAGMISKVIVGVLNFYFKKDVATVVISRFTDILDEDMKAKCRAACSKISQCIDYMQGVPEKDVNHQHMQLLATDVHIRVGMDEVLYHGEKIRDMVKKADVKKMDNLFEHAQLYCCLTTFRELLILYRLTVQTRFSVNANSIRNVLNSQKATDAEVLKFLYRPSTANAEIFRRCIYPQWPLMQHFLYWRGLQPERLNDLSERIIKIRSILGSGEPVKPSKDKRRFLVLADDDTNTTAVHMELRGANNVFTLWSHFYNPLKQVHYNSEASMCISDGEPSRKLSLWHVVRLEPEPPLEKTCYMLRLHAFQDRWVYWYGTHVGLKSDSKKSVPCLGYLWDLEIVS